ncbi:MAG: cell division protein ZapE [Alphaproteobacteria bacterium]|jgi:cell division protein ZapE|nr:cell division protein ZapE [Alphaproteobacteria bacterium]
MIEGPVFTYRALRRAGELSHDPIQELTAEKLQSLHNAVKGYRPANGAGGWKSRLGLARRPEDPPQGLYIFGPAGRGKSMLMDMFFQDAPTERRRRVHFHAFMVEIHDELHRLRQDPNRRKNSDPLLKIAAGVADEAWLLCFDEFHISNIADAMILGRLFEALFEHGVVVVATSNLAPDELYEGGLQRELFLPFIDMIKDRLDVLELASPTDYRRAHIHDVEVYHTPLGAEASAALDAAFAELTAGARAVAEELAVKGRSVRIEKAARGVARFDFEGLCGSALGAEDYLAIGDRYHTIVLADVPIMAAPELGNEAKRFINLVDVLYEDGVNLVVTADAEPDLLCPEGPNAFEFQRTASRLMEMRSGEYIDAPHREGEA